jgi:hypothetical protein
VKTPPLKAIWGEGGVRLLAGDACIFILLAALTVTMSLAWAKGKGAAAADVSVSGDLSFRLPLDEDAVRDAAGPLGATRVEVRSGQVRVLSSPCPLKLCEKRGWIDRGGDMIVCLPNEVVVRLPGTSPDGVDATSR